MTTAQTQAPSVLDALEWGTKLAGNNVTVYSAPTGVGGDGYTCESVNDYEKAQFAKVFASIENVTGLAFTNTTDPDADFQLVLDTNEVGGGFYC
jgi:serralysin